MSIRLILLLILSVVMNRIPFILSVLLTFTFIPFTVEAETVKKKEGYFTTEDIISDIALPVLDRKVQKEYKDELIQWQWRGIADLHYNSNHSYDIAIRIEVHPQPVKGINTYGIAYDLATLRISPSCDSNKINKLVCKHGFKVELIGYEHLSHQE